MAPFEAIRATVFKFKDFLQKFGVTSSGFVELPNPGVELTIQERDPRTTETEVRNQLNKMMKFNPKLKIALVVLPYADGPLYNSIKTAGDMLGVHTVCVISEKFMKDQRQDQYFGNIALKFNLKCGGVNHAVAPQDLGIVGQGKTMLVGMDVTHPSPGSTFTAPSVAAIVSSKDALLAQWHSEFATQKRREEMVQGLKEMFTECLKAWRANNKVLPENILVYRDGVSEGQYQLVQEQEIPPLRDACTALYQKGATPKMTFIICGKRHNTRFYPVNDKMDRYGNCPAGTVVDRGVTESRNWDFFLQPHASIQGTAKPCHYFVVLNDVFSDKTVVNSKHTSSADTLEGLTHNICYLFGRATKAVSLCPPAYYADILCERIRCYLSSEFDPGDDAQSQSSGGRSQSLVATPPVHNNLKGTMFFI